MKLKNILVGIENLKAKGDLEQDIIGIESNSKKVKPGYIFVAIKGFSFDGHQYIEEAVKNGAIAVVVEEINKELISKLSNITIIVAKNTREFLAIASSNFYENPSKKFKLIGITGTKGKTTTTYMIKDILEKAGKKVGLIGTVAVYINGEKIEDSERTTPESLELQKIFSKMVEQGTEYVVMEVSSQSLKLHRVDGCDFDMVVFTNLSEDHISAKEHPNTKDYFESKLKLFKMCKTGFVNIDDLYGAKIPSMFPDSEITRYGIDNPGEVIAKDITITNSSVDFKVKLSDRNERVKVDIPGRFTVYNALVAICICKKIGVDPEIIKDALLKVKVPGRSEMVDNKLELPIMIDFAHTPESLQNILKAVKSYTKGRVICVFGCGGDRDARKRPLMGEISGKIADYTIVTSDNPRTEDPQVIVNQIEEGIKKTKGKYEVIVDRKEAIKKAIEMAKKTDIVVLAGKGHELYQEINDKKYDFDERTIIREIIKNINKKG